LGIITIGEKGDAKGQIQAGGKNLIETHFSESVRRPQHPNSSRPTFRDEYVSIWCHANEPRLIQIARKTPNLEPQRYVQSGVGRFCDDRRTVCCEASGVRRW